jgi:hypothetical protein
MATRATRLNLGPSGDERMGYQPEYAGMDSLGRRVFRVYVPNIQALATVAVPSAPFVLFLAGDTTNAVPEHLFEVARTLLSSGAVYVMCWGPGCEVAEEIVDEAIAGDGGNTSFHHVMTTAHADEALSDALEFATTLAIPDNSFADDTRTVLVAFAGNVNCYNEGHNCLEDLLT